MLQPKIAPTLSQSILTLWDMDDTLLALYNLAIKNPHLLLAILLYQTYAPHQHIGILTNRSPQDNEVPEYTVKRFLEQVKEFGINIPEEQVIFGGGTHAARPNEEYDTLKKAIATLSKQMQSLSVAGNSEFVSNHALALNQMMTELSATKFEGKNFFIIDFLNTHLQTKTNLYAFASGTCSKENLAVILVDDNKNIVRALSHLGAQFVGIQASLGGNLPKLAEEYDFYNVNYLHAVADQIGLKSYAEKMLEGAEDQCEASVMMRLAALLYAWQAGHGQCTLKHFEQAEKRLSDTQCNQFFQLLHYLHSRKDFHPLAQFRPVTLLLPIFKARADLHFLTTFTEKFSQVDRQIFLLKLVKTNEAGAPPQTEKKGFSGLLQRMPSRNRSVPAQPSIELPAENLAEIKILEDRKNALVTRLNDILQDKQSDHASLARAKYEWLMSLNTPTATSVSTHLHAREAIASTTTVYAPGAESARASLRSASSAPMNASKAASATSDPNEKPRKAGSSLH